MMRYYLSLGSNLDDRLENLKYAINCLNKHGNVVSMSKIYQTNPVFMEEGTPDFYNMVVEYLSPLKPFELLEKSTEIEQSMGRTTKGSPHLSRSIDIDIVFSGKNVIHSPQLTIPHVDMENRAFVLVPLNEIAPDFIHPVLKKTVRELCSQLNEIVEIKALDKDFLK